MIIKHYDGIEPQKLPDTFYCQSWKPTWYGVPRLAECKSEFAEYRYNMSVIKAHNEGLIAEREYEVDCFLSILQDIKERSVTFIEVGAGYGEWCMALTGTVRNNIVSLWFKDFQCIAVEAEPKHYEWCYQHFKAHDIPGHVIWAAVADSNGRCDFSIMPNAADWYGQSIRVGNGLLRSASNILRRKSINVHCYTLDTIAERKKLEHIDLLHVDVQGAECRVVKGAKNLIEAGKIDYWMFGTHGWNYNKALLEALEPHYEVVVNMSPNRVTNNVRCEDGVMVFKRRGL